MNSTIKAAPPVYGPLRLTIPAREALERAGNIVTRVADIAGCPAYSVELRRPPPEGVEICLIDYGAERYAEQHRGIRLAVEPPYPGEFSGGISCWERGDWVPCPRCGGALVWYEAGYVPGYRLCTKGHHAQLSSDGRAAKAAR